MYYLVYGLLWLVSLLPLRVLYIISDGIGLFVYYVLKYRRDVVMNNLQIAFPEKTVKEREAIARKFYRNMIDTFIETIKMLSASDRFIERHMQGNWDDVNKFRESGKSVQLHLGHNFNWEWANARAAQAFTIPFVGVYMPLTNKIFDRLFYHMRSKRGTLLVRATHMREDFMPYRNKQYVLGLVADQNPGAPGSAWWFNFFGKPTPFVKGPAKNAIANNTAVFFTFIHKEKRGRYEMVFSLATDNPASMTEEELTGHFVKYLENVIRTYPDMWLWSHRRWKWQWDEGYGPVRE